MLNKIKMVQLYIYIWAALGLHCCMQAFSSCSKQELLFVAVHGLLIAVASLVAEHGLQQLQHVGSVVVTRGPQSTWASVVVALELSGCSAWALGPTGFSSCGSRAQAQQLWCTGLVGPWHVGSSRTRDRTRVPCIGRRILNHCATREVPAILISVKHILMNKEKQYIMITFLKRGQS